MKYLIALVVMCFVFRFSECLTKEQRMEMFMQMAKECASKEGASQADVDEMAARKPASSKGGKCIRACISENVGIMKNNQVDVDGVTSVTKMAFENDAAKVQTATELAKACVGVTDTDRCEAAYKIFECGRKVAMDKGLNFDDL